MNRWSALTIILLVGVFLAFGGSKSSVQEIARKDDLNTHLLPLVGESCTVNLKNGDMVKGTLWDFGEGFITLKIKKGLLYSKAEIFRLSEISYIESSDGRILNIPALLKNRDKQKETTSEQEPSPLFFKTGDLVSEEDSKRKPPPEEREEDNIDNSFRFLDSERRTQTREPEQYKQQPTSERFQSTRTRLETSSETSQDRPEDSSPESVTQEQTSQVSQSAPPVSEMPEGSPPSHARERLKTGQAQGAAAPSAKKAKTSEVRSLKETRHVRVLEYQNIILFSFSTLIMAMLLFLKIFGMNGTAYGKETFFPAHVVKKNGQYGIIDQGLVDGIKLHDQIRLYRKEGGEIVSKGKVRVIRVAENYSAVEMLKSARRDGYEIDVGDVGFRDRNILVTALKRFRIVVGHTFSNLAKGLETAAQSLEKEDDDMTVDSELLEEEKREKREPQPEETKKESKDSSEPTRKESGSTSSIKDEPRTLGFGLDDL